MVDRANEEELRHRIANGSRDAVDFRKLAGLLTDADRNGEAIDVLEQALRLPIDPPSRADVLSQLAWLLYERTPESERARMLAHDGLRCLTGESETSDVLFVRGMLESLLAHERFTADAKSGNELARAAVATFERLLSEAPDWEDEEAWIEAARVYCAVGDGMRAIPLAERFLRVDVGERRRVSGLLVLAEAQRLAGQLQDAEATAAEALRLSRTHLERLHSAHTLGLVQKESGQLTAARLNLEQALAALDTHQAVKEDPDWRRTLHILLAETYTALGQHNEAIAAWRQLLRWHDDDDLRRPRILLCLADACEAAGELAEARTWYDAVLHAPFTSDEDRAGARVELLWSEGRLQYQNDELDEAARTFERLLDHYRDDDADRRSVLRWLGECDYSAGKFDRAWERYDEIAGSPRASDDEKTRALLSAERSRGRNHYEACRYAEAAESFERVLAGLTNGRDRCDGLLWLAACYLHMGSYGSARDCYEEVVGTPGASEDQLLNARRSLAALQRKLE